MANQRGAPQESLERASQRDAVLYYRKLLSRQLLGAMVSGGVGLLSRLLVVVPLAVVFFAPDAARKILNLEFPRFVYFVPLLVYVVYELAKANFRNLAVKDAEIDRIEDRHAREREQIQERHARERDEWERRRVELEGGRARLQAASTVMEGIGAALEVGDQRLRNLPRVKQKARRADTDEAEYFELERAWLRNWTDGVMTVIRENARQPELWTRQLGVGEGEDGSWDLLEEALSRRLDVLRRAVIALAGRGGF
jgi:hypothetical protein